MSNYYNEFDPFAADWLAALMKEGLIPDGEIDRRSIADVHPADLIGFRQCHFFAGIGGWPLALRYAGREHEELWTGRCPCQPFSAAGKRKGFADDRHLWPVWQHLIQKCRPPVVFGEQVASAADWLRLVRGDLEAMEYAVGAMPVEAASAGADHLRDRFWFVANDGRGRRAGSGEEQIQQSRRAEAERAGDLDLADDDDDARSQGRALSAEGADQWLAGADGVADADESQRRIGDEQPARQFAEQQQDPGARALGDGASIGGGAGLREGDTLSDGNGSAGPGGAFEWVIGADGKARRVKSGVRLLVDGFPNRVGLLRGFGNAIDPRPAAAFIASAFDAIAMSGM